MRKLQRMMAQRVRLVVLLCVVLALLLANLTPLAITRAEGLRAPRDVMPAVPHAVPAAQAANDDEPAPLPENVILPGRFDHERTRRTEGQSIVAALDADPAVAQIAAFGAQRVRALVDLQMPPLASVTRSLSPGERSAYAAQVAAAQEVVAQEIVAQGGEIMGRLTTLSSGLIVAMPGNLAPSIAQLPQVASLGLIQDYALDLSETVPEIGASLVHSLGLTGEGIVVAVIDSGVDYTHLAFGGPGTIAAFDDAYYGDAPGCINGTESVCAHSQSPDPSLFGPGNKVAGGYDWLGERWPNAFGISPDDNPIDIQGHGTHVADIIAGLAYTASSNIDGAYPAKGAGVAPDAELWALRVCAASVGSCNGVAILLALDDAADMDNDPETIDPVDVANLSLGSNYGQPEDDGVGLVDELAAYGVIVVISAGNGGDPPYMVGQPSVADGALSVAQTSVPSAGRYPLEVLQPPSVAGMLTSSIWQSWSVDPMSGGVVSGTLIYGDGDTSNTLGCGTFDTDLTGLVVLVDRGSCDFTLKAKNASAAGAAMTLIGMVSDASPFDGTDGLHRPISNTVFMISQAEADLLRAGLDDGVTKVQLDPSLFVALNKTIVDTSSRGPRINDSVIKPEIGAPGASVSAVAGGGTATSRFGGTSGAAPMVAGVAALLKQQYGATLDLHEYRALLMNNANPLVHLVDPLTGEKGELAEITRMGSGQVDAVAAHDALILAWDSTDANPLRWTGALSFGYVAATANRTLTRTLTVKNLQGTPVNANLAAIFRYANDQNQGVQISVQPSTIALPANGETQVAVILQLNPSDIKPWAIDKGEFGGDSAAFRDQEYDGFVLITPTVGITVGPAIHLPWHVLPKAAAGMITTTVPSAGALSGMGSLTNQSLLIGGKVETFDLVAQDPNDYDYTVGDCAGLDMEPGCNRTAIDLKDVGVRARMEETGSGDEYVLEFAFTLWDKPYRAAQLPVEIDIYIDYDRDGSDDYQIFNADLRYGQDPLDGGNMVWVWDYESGDRTPYFYTLSDFNTQSYILRVPAAAVEVTEGQQFDFAVTLFDAYFTGQQMDCSPALNSLCTGAHTYTAGQPAFAIPEAQRSFSTAPGATTSYSYQWSVAGANASPSQIGLLFLYDTAAVGRESDAVPLATPAGALAVSQRASAAAVEVGQGIDYHVHITNTGTLTVTNVTAEDDLLGSLTLGKTTLAPGAATTATVSYTTLQIDYPGPLVNTVTATATPLLGNDVVASATATVTLTVPPTGLAVGVRPSVASVYIGDEVSYLFRITNTGAVTLTNLTASDDTLGAITLPTSTLAPGAMTSTSVNYVPWFGDLPGPLVNVVQVNGTPPIGSLVQVTASATVAVSQPEIGLRVKITPSTSVANVGAPIAYHYEFANIGVTPLVDVTAKDSLFDILPLGNNTPATTLAPGATLALVQSYVVSRGDLPGPLINLVTANATPQLGEELIDAIVVTASTSVSLTDGDLLVVKSVGIDGIQPPCSSSVFRVVPISTTVVYCYTIQNVGHQTFTHHSLVDSDLGQILDNAARILPPGDAYSVTVTKTMSVSVTNVATWTATLDDSPPITDAVAAAMVTPTLDSRVVAAIRISHATEDQDADTLPDNTEGAADLDRDNLPNFLDDDSDGDGILDIDEVGPDPLNPRDSNGDGIPDYLSPQARIYFPRLRR